MDNSDEKFLAIIEANKGLLYKVANSYCRDVDDRKDLIQEITIHLWKSFERYDDHFKLSTWLYRIALNVAISFYRKEKPRKNNVTSLSETMIEIADEGQTNETEDNINLLQQFISELKELDKALMLLYLDDKSYKEMADILGISETNVSTKISRIKEKLKIKFSLTN